MSATVDAKTDRSSWRRDDQLGCPVTHHGGALTGVTKGHLRVSGYLSMSGAKRRMMGIHDCRGILTSRLTLGPPKSMYQ